MNPPQSAPSLSLTPRSKTRRVFWILLGAGLLAILALLAAGAYSGFKKGKQRRAEQAALQQTASEINELLSHRKKAIGEAPELTVTSKKSDEGNASKIQSLMEKAGTGDTNEAKLFNVITQRNKSMSEANRQRDELVAEFKQFQVPNLENVKTGQDLQVRRDLGVKIIETHQKLISLIDGTEKLISDGLLAEGVNPDQAGKMAKVFNDNLAKYSGEVDRLHRLDIQVMENLIDWMDFIQTEWGHWTAENGNLSFANEEAVSSHQEFMNRFKELSGERALQKSKMAKMISESK